MSCEQISISWKHLMNGISPAIAAGINKPTNTKKMKRNVRTEKQICQLNQANELFRILLHLKNAKFTHFWCFVISNMCFFSSDLLFDVRYCIVRVYLAVFTKINIEPKCVCVCMSCNETERESEKKLSNAQINNQNKKKKKKKDTKRQAKSKIDILLW